MSQILSVMKCVSCVNVISLDIKTGWYIVGTPVLNNFDHDSISVPYVLQMYNRLSLGKACSLSVTCLSKKKQNNTLQISFQF